MGPLHQVLPHKKTTQFKIMEIMLSTFGLFKNVNPTEIEYGRGVNDNQLMLSSCDFTIF